MAAAFRPTVEIVPGSLEERRIRAELSGNRLMEREGCGDRSARGLEALRSWLNLSSAEPDEPLGKPQGIDRP